MATTVLPNGNGGGYGYCFVNTPPETLICAICFLPSKEPHLITCCGHTFCKICLEGSKNSGSICPMCRSEEFAAVFNKQADRMIQSLHVFCTNKEQGCEWQGEVNDITNHLGDCLFQVVHCPKVCGKSLQRQYLTNHVETECPRRTVSCQYCNDVGEYQFIEGQHKEECPKFPVQCPNECEIESIHRDEVEEHREVCPLEMIQCDYHVVGCEVKMARKDMNTHKQEKMEVHLLLSINKLMETNMQLESTVSTQNKLKHEVEKAKEDFTQLLEHTENITAKLMASQQEAKRTEDQLLQKLTATEKELNTTKQQLATTCQNLTKAEKEHTTLAASTDKALAEMENKIQTKVTEVVPTTAEKYIVELESKLQQKIMRIEGIVHNHWLTSLRNQASKVISGNQVVPVVVKMTEFTKNKGTTWSSKPFCDSNDKECQLYLQVATSKLRPSYMSVSLLTHGLKKRLTGTYVVKLLNQISDSEHYLGDTSSQTKKVSNASAVWQNDSFITYQDLHKVTATCQFFKNDALFFEVLKS